MLPSGGRWCQIQLMACSKCVFCACSFPSLLFLPFSLAGKGEKIPSRFAVYRVVFNKSRSMQ